MGDHSDDDQQPNEPSPRKRGRGIAKLNNIVVRHGLGNAGPIPVQFDDNCSPIGATGAAFVTYIGITVRRRISILIDNWKFIKQEDKQEWLAEIRVCFTINFFIFITLNSIYILETHHIYVCFLFRKCLISLTPKRSTIMCTVLCLRFGGTSRLDLPKIISPKRRSLELRVIYTTTLTQRLGMSLLKSAKIQSFRFVCVNSVCCYLIVGYNLHLINFINTLSFLRN